jgi:hypothetical protein
MLTHILRPLSSWLVYNVQLNHTQNHTQMLVFSSRSQSHRVFPTVLAFSRVWRT